MKTRVDFVTNSSSSSYVIAYRKPPQIDEETLARYPFIRLYAKMIEGIVSCENCEDTKKGKVFAKKEEYDKWFLDYHGWADKTLEEILEEEPGLKKAYDKVIKYFEDGFSILHKDIDRNDDGLMDLIDTIGEDNEDFVILNNE